MAGQAQDVQAAGKLLVSGRTLNATDIANIRGSLEDGTTRVIKNNAENGSGRAVFCMPLAQAGQAKSELKAKLANITTTDEVDAAVAEYLQELHAKLVELGIIVKGCDSSVDGYPGFYDLCLESTKSYLNARPSLRQLAAT